MINQILAAKQKDSNADTSTLKQQIDKMVYALYDLTPEEIAIVEGGKVKPTVKTILRRQGGI